MRKRVTPLQVGAHQLDDGLVVLIDVGFEVLEGSEDVVLRPMVGKEQAQECLHLESRWLRARAGPLAQCGATLVRDRVHTPCSASLILLDDGGISPLDELLRLGVEESFRLRPCVPKTPCRLLGQLVGRPWLEVEECEDCV